MLKRVDDEVVVRRKGKKGKKGKEGSNEEVKKVANEKLTQSIYKTRW